jgi:uridine kinase
MKKPIVIGVAGGTGSGKTTLVRAIADKINHSDIVVMQQDSFYKDRSHLPPSEREKLNHDHPDALETSLLLQNLKDLVAGNPVEIPEYDFVSHPKTKPQFFYLCVRRLQRDTIERQRSVESVVKQYMESVRPMHIEFVGPNRKYADMIVPGSNNNVAVDMVASMVGQKGLGRKRIDLRVDR